MKREEQKTVLRLDSEIKSAKRKSEREWEEKKWVLKRLNSQRPFKACKKTQQQ